MNVEGLICNTRLLRLKRCEEYYGLGTKLYAKAEMSNPSGSIKDRAALAMLRRLEFDNEICHGAKIYEASSGNLGISLAMLSSIRGYRARIIMPRTASEERRKIILSYGGEIIDGGEDMASSILKLRDILKEDRVAKSTDQFKNPEAFKCHFSGTGRELWEDMQRNIDIFLTGVGTGATLGGVGAFLKLANPRVKIVAVEPSLDGDGGGCGIEGIGAGVELPLLRGVKIDQTVKVKASEAAECRKALARCEGLFVGPSSGASLAAAIRESILEENEGKSIAFILCDSADRYFSRGLLD